MVHTSKPVDVHDAVCADVIGACQPAQLDEQLVRAAPLAV